MPTPEVIAKVRELHSELAETQPSPATAPHLDTIREQVDTIMLQPDRAELYTSLNDRLLLAYVGFQIDHPKLAAAMQNAMTAIAAAGL